MLFFLKGILLCFFCVFLVFFEFLHFFFFFKGILLCFSWVPFWGNFLKGDSLGSS